MNGLRLWTLGHSTRTQAAFIELLQHYGIRALADVRRHPGSRRLPQFGQQALDEGLARHGIEYHWLGQTLGGRRRPQPDSVNDGWRNASFRGYADHLSSPEFAAGLAQLLALAQAQPTAIMCAELLWWRCHRALIADVLKARGVQVIHIQDPKTCAEHPFTSAAQLIDGRLSYRALASQGRLFD
jgi:uncharacterized protein (DUF488 family)